MVEQGKGATDGAIESTEDKVYNVYTENIKVEETRVDKGGKKTKVARTVDTSVYGLVKTRETRGPIECVVLCMKNREQRTLIRKKEATRDAVLTKLRSRIKKKK